MALNRVRSMPFLLALCLTRPAWGNDDAPQWRAASIALFEHAERLSAAGDFSVACPKYAESYRLTPALNSLLAWADCLSSEGKLASAHAAFREAIELARRTADARAAAADERARALEPRLNFLTVSLAEDALLPNLRVERSGVALDRAAWDTAIPVDPGTYTVLAWAQGYEPWQAVVAVEGEGTSRRVEVPELRALRAPSLPTAAKPPAELVGSGAPPAKRPAPRANSASDRASSRRTAGWAIAAAGAAGLGAGALFLFKRGSALEERDGICPSGLGCEPGTNAKLAALTDEARFAQTAATLSLGAGAALVGAGCTLILVNRPAKARSERASVQIVPVLQPNGGGFSVQARL